MYELWGRCSSCWFLSFCIRTEGGRRSLIICSGRLQRRLCLIDIQLLVVLMLFHKICHKLNINSFCTCLERKKGQLYRSNPSVARDFWHFCKVLDSSLQWRHWLRLKRYDWSIDRNVGSKFGYYFNSWRRKDFSGELKKHGQNAREHMRLKTVFLGLQGQTGGNCSTFNTQTNPLWIDWKESRHTPYCLLVNRCRSQ